MIRSCSELRAARPHLHILVKGFIVFVNKIFKNEMPKDVGLDNSENKFLKLQNVILVFR